MAMRNLNALWICLGAADQRENSQCVFSRINPSFLAGIQTTGWKGGDNPVQVWSRVLSIGHKIIRLFFRELGPCFSLKLRGRWKKKKKGVGNLSFASEVTNMPTSLPAFLPACLWTPNICADSDTQSSNKQHCSAQTAPTQLTWTALQTLCWT